MSEQNAAPPSPAAYPAGPPPAAPPGFPAGTPAPGAPGAAPSKKRGVMRRVLVYVVGIVVVLGGGFAYRYFTGDPETRAEVGSCIADVPAVSEGQEAKANNAKVVECTSADAKYKVVGRFEDKTKTEADTLCGEIAETEAIFTSIGSSGKGLVLCLAPPK